jgi:hypothetical protein
MVFILSVVTFAGEPQSLYGEAFITSDHDGNLVIFIDRLAPAKTDGFVDDIFYIQTERSAGAVQYFATDAIVNVADGALTLFARDESFDLFTYLPGKGPGAADLAAASQPLSLEGFGITHYRAAPFVLTMAKAMEDELYVSVLCIGGVGGSGSLSCSVTCPATYNPLSCNTTCAPGYYASCGCQMKIDDKIYNRACCRCEN